MLDENGRTAKRSSPELVFLQSVANLDTSVPFTNRMIDITESLDIFFSTAGFLDVRSSLEKRFTVHALMVGMGVRQNAVILSGAQSTFSRLVFEFGALLLPRAGKLRLSTCGVKNDEVPYP
ncbi:hypothetical protein EVAR_38287_1 [Eumeta japonica]|uniref:Uncharacterized protein n=1 Tax=Eumeta variegata TaxID=151549 RepID=A0A4C1WAK5_EUMVA|nr:hypothetical protein EVAR_38287_1 [Eumeta japonica]